MYRLVLWGYVTVRVIVTISILIILCEWYYYYIVIWYYQWRVNYTTKTNDYNYVRVHDCLYTKKEIDTAELYQFIKKETGIDTLFVNPERKQLPDDELYKMMNFSSLKKK